MYIFNQIRKKNLKYFFFIPPPAPEIGTFSNMLFNFSLLLEFVSLSEIWPHLNLRVLFFYLSIVLIIIPNFSLIHERRRFTLP